MIVDVTFASKLLLEIVKRWDSKSSAIYHKNAKFVLFSPQSVSLTLRGPQTVIESRVRKSNKCNLKTLFFGIDVSK